MAIKHDKFPLVIVFHENDRDHYYLARNHEEFTGAFRDKFMQRRDLEGYWYHDEAGHLPIEDDAQAVYEFMQRRGDGEYEGFEFETPTIVGETK